MRALIVLLSALAGLVVGAVIAAAAVLIIGSLAGASEFEGALSMQAVFGAGPVGAVVGLIFAVWLALRWTARKSGD